MHLKWPFDSTFTVFYSGKIYKNVKISRKNAIDQTFEIYLKNKNDSEEKQKN